MVVCESWVFLSDIRVNQPVDIVPIHQYNQILYASAYR